MSVNPGDAPVPAITLTIAAGPPRAEIGPLAKGIWRIGRAPENDVVLVEVAVSRLHAELRPIDGRWHLRDLDSTQGTFVNATRSPAQVDVLLVAGDHLRIGPWTFVVRLADASAAAVPASLRRPMTIGSVPQQRLRALFALAHTAQSADDDTGLLAALCRDLGDSLAYDRVALLREDAERVHAVALHTRQPGAAQRAFSTTLLRAAEPEAPAVLESIAPAELGASLIANPVAHVLCIRLVGVAEPTWLYLDRAEPFADSDGSVLAYVEAAARIAALAISHRDGLRAMAERERLAADLAQARAVQKQLCASRSDRAGAIDYAFSTEPGSGMCGDFVDVLQARDGAVWCIVGDVVGHGAAAAMLMATALAILRSECRRSGNAAVVADHLATELAHVLAKGQFITLWLARIERDGRTEVVDAGHGQCWLRDRHRQLSRPQLRGHPPIGVLADARHESERLMLAVGDCLVVATDGYSDALQEPEVDAAFTRAISDASTPGDVVARIRTAINPDRCRDDASVLVLARQVPP